MGINIYPTVNINKQNFRANTTAQQLYFAPVSADSFVKESSRTQYLRRLEELFPNGELERTYDQMCKELKLDYKPTLKFTTDVKENSGGGYTFHSNTVTLSLEDILGSNTKLYGIKNGEKILQIDSKGVPVIVSPQVARILTTSPQAAKHRGLDKIIAEKATNEDQKKLFLQKLYHELIHAKQHMIMRQTDGIGAKQIIQAWRHLPKNAPIPNIIINQSLENIYQKSFWKDNATPIKYAENSEMGKYGYKCLDAVQNYAPVDSPEYDKNYLEIEAYQESSKYIKERFGEWQ